MAVAAEAVAGEGDGRPPHMVHTRFALALLLPQPWASVEMPTPRPSEEHPPPAGLSACTWPAGSSAAAGWLWVGGGGVKGASGNAVTPT